jgi:hypothetical protein
MSLSQLASMYTAQMPREQTGVDAFSLVQKIRNGDVLVHEVNSGDEDFVCRDNAGRTFYSKPPALRFTRVPTRPPASRPLGHHVYPNLMVATKCESTSSPSIVPKSDFVCRDNAGRTLYRQQSVARLTESSTRALSVHQLGHRTQPDPVVTCKLELKSSLSNFLTERHSVEDDSAIPVILSADKVLSADTYASVCMLFPDPDTARAAISANTSVSTKCWFSPVGSSMSDASSSSESKMVADEGGDVDNIRAVMFMLAPGEHL